LGGAVDILVEMLFAQAFDDHFPDWSEALS
jgi:hypothetical protein